jgi:pimeloyl-ACP methyl ester carboxylesterase
VEIETVFISERNGDRQTFVFVHGFCQSSAYWTPTVDRLAGIGAHCLAPDLPGFGASAGQGGPFTMEAYADALAAVLDARGIGGVTLVGGSMGGVVAQHFALRHPHLLRRLLLVATGAVTANPAAALAKADELAGATWNEAAVTPIVNGFFHRPPTAERLAEFRSIALSASQPAAIEAARSNARSRTFERLGEIRLPTLIVQGRHDRARTPEHGAEMRERIPGGRLEVIEDAGHTPQLEQADAFHKIALPFLLGCA